jgi:peptidoglycan/LPS O-acetylase OafA/YrhL
MPSASIPKQSSRSRTAGLDTLRAAAILLVFAYHYQVFVSHQPTFGWLSEIGWTGVDLFFVLSGYLIGNQIFAGIADGQPLSLKQFYARRLLRTLPNYWLVLALYLLFPLTMGGKTPPPLWRFLTFTQNLWLHPGTAFSHAWSLCIEEQFYLLLPAAALIGVRYVKSIRAGWLLLATLMVVGIVTRCVLWMQYGREDFGDIGGYYPNVYYSSFCRMDEFLPGIAVAMLKNFHHPSWERLTRHGHAIFALGSAASAAMLYGLLRFYYIDDYGYGFFMSGFGYSLLAVAFALLVMAALSPSCWLHRLRIPGAASLALWSYAIYLSHKPLAVIVQKVLGDVGVSASGAAGIAMIAVVCLLVGWLLYRLVETPFMQLRDRYFPSNVRASTTTAVGAGVTIA